MINKPILYKVLGAVAFLSLIAIGYIVYARIDRSSSTQASFDGESALADASFQVSLGPRIPGSSAHDLEISWLKTYLTLENWDVEIQNNSDEGHLIENVIAKRGQGTPWIILGAHYDSRMWADQDPDPGLRQNPVPGANDGASGVAVLVELARTLPVKLQDKIWLVFFDAEDDGDIPGWDWLLGSETFVTSLNSRPDMVVVVDMVGDSNLDIYKEKNSNPDITNAIWDQAAKLGYSSFFIDSYKYSMLDDHTPFLNAGIPAIDIIDFDYPYWHTTHDTIDKISANSLQVVGATLWNWIVNSTK